MVHHDQPILTRCVVGCAGWLHQCLVRLLRATSCRGAYSQQLFLGEYVTWTFSPNNNGIAHQGYAASPAHINTVWFRRMRAARPPTSLTYEFVWCCAQVGDFSQHRACAGTPDACPAGCAELCWSCCFVWTLLQAEACALQQLIATAAWLKAGAVTTRAQHFVAKGRWCLLIPGQATRACSNQHDETKDSASVCSCCLGVSNSLSCTSTATWLMVMINSLNDSLLGGIGSRSSNTARLVNWLFGCPRKPAKSQLDFLSISPAIAPQPSPAAWISSCVNLVLLLLPVCCLHTRSPPPSRQPTCCR